MSADVLGLVGQTLDGQLSIEALVGMGDGTCVYRARHLVLEAPVAVKFAIVIPRDGTRPGDQVFAEAVRLHYRLERKTLKVARVMSSGSFTMPLMQTSGPERAPYLVREWFEGGPLSAYLATRRARSMGGRPIGAVIAALAPVADALEHAHADGVAHLALNPRNVLLTGPEPEGAKVADFGLAAALNGDDQNGKRTGWRPALAAYLSPEQLEGRWSEAGPASDVYSLALLVLELLRDLPVHVNEATRGEVLDASGQATRRAADPALPREARDVLTKALSRDPAARFQEVGAFWSELSRAALAIPSMPNMSPAIANAVDDWDPDAVTAPKVTVPRRKDSVAPVSQSSASLQGLPAPTPPPPVINLPAPAAPPPPPPSLPQAPPLPAIASHASHGSNGPSSSRKLPAAPPNAPHSSPRGMLAAPPLPTGLGFTPPEGISSPKSQRAASTSSPPSPAPVRFPSSPVSTGPHSPPPPRFEAPLPPTIVEIPGVLTPSFDALAASQQSSDGDSVTFDVTPAPVLPMAPWPPSSRNAARAQPETTVRILRTSAVREGLVAVASFFVVCVIGFGIVFFFGDALHLTHRTVDQPAPPTTTAEPPRRP